MKILVTGGAGFIGSAVIRYLINETEHKVFNLDKLNYAGNLNSLSSISKSSRYKFTQGDICDHELVSKIFKDFKPDAVMHLAAESHVDNSIKFPGKFIQSNILGTYNILRSINKNIFLLHISTDEVYGHVENNKSFNEKTSYNPRSPYSSSKASADHLVSAWNVTYNYKSTIVNCCNNFGPNQDGEKFIGHTFKGKYLDCGTMQGYIKSSMEISKL